MPRLNGEDLNIEGCNYEAEGVTAADVLRMMLAHLESEHGIELPDPDTILTGNVDEERLDHGTKLVLERIRQRLDLTDKGSSEPGVQPRTPPGR